MNDTTRTHRLSSLLDAQVLDAGGRLIGWVRDIRLDGSRTDLPPHPSVRGFFVTRKRIGSMLGFGHAYQQGPWLIAVVMRRRHRNDQYVPWAQVEQLDWDADPVTIRLQQP